MPTRAEESHDICHERRDLAITTTAEWGKIEIESRGKTSYRAL